MQTFRRIRRSIAVLLLVLYVPACYRYVTPKGMTPQEYIVAEQPGQVRVILTDGTRQTILRPSISQDSLRGHIVYQANGFVRPGPAWAVSLERVQRVEVSKFNAGGTVALVVGGLAAVGAVAVGVYFSCCFDPM